MKTDKLLPKKLNRRTKVLECRIKELLTEKYNLLENVDYSRDKLIDIEFSLFNKMSCYATLCSYRCF
jgi:hypothetical protein